MSTKPPEVLEFANEYVEFLNACKSPWHVIDRVRTYFRDAGFQELTMENTWNLQAGQKYYIVKGGSTIMAFALGGQWTPSSRLAFAAPHSDSPALRIKPDSNRGAHGFIQIGVGLYGGGMWHTWGDRDLGIAGRVYVRNGSQIECRLLTIRRAVCNIPGLAIHFDSSRNTNLMLNFETQLLPMIGIGNVNEDPDGNHQPMLMNLLASELNVQPADILEFELNLFDTNPAAIGGANDDFIFGQFQDNQYCSFVAMKAMIDAVNAPEFSTAPHAYVYGTYDHEEVGNKSDVGASSDWSMQVLQRVTGPENIGTVLNKSYALSADVDHGLNPNFPEYMEIKSRPALEGGPVIKYNYSMEFATTSQTAVIAREFARRANSGIQSSIPINNKRTGSTHGPALSALLGIPSCDLGPPLISMHSIREISGTMGAYNLLKFITQFYRDFSDVMDNFVPIAPPNVSRLMLSCNCMDCTNHKHCDCDDHHGHHDDKHHCHHHHHHHQGHNHHDKSHKSGESSEDDTMSTDMRLKCSLCAASNEKSSAEEERRRSMYTVTRRTKHGRRSQLKEI